MKNIINKISNWKESKKINHVTEMSSRTAMAGMIFFGFAGSFFLLIVSKSYYDFVVTTNKLDEISLEAVVVGLLLAAVALIAFAFGILFQICNKVYIDKIFDKGAESK
jgi:uncharacterized membrane protein